MGPAAHLIFAGGQDLRRVDLAPLAPQPVEDVVLLVLERPLGTPAEVVGWVVKVFVPGVVRSEWSYIEHVIANVRPWREYEASVNRLWRLEDESRR